MEENYSNVHRAFLQACSRHSVVNIAQALTILESVQKTHGNEHAAADDAALRQMVEEINAKLSSREIEQRLNFVNFEWNEPIGEFLVLCNTFAAVGPSPAYNEPECAYMKKLMERIVTSEEHSISLMTAIQMTSTSLSAISQSQFTQSQSQSQSTLKKITKQRAEDLVEEWMNAGYFVAMENGEVMTLGPKSIAEFGDTLCAKFGDFIQNCHLCNKLALKAMYCPNSQCETPLDKRCFKNYVSKQKKCPVCKSNWENSD